VPYVPCGTKAAIEAGSIQRRFENDDSRNVELYGRCPLNGNHGTSDPISRWQDWRTICSQRFAKAVSRETFVPPIVDHRVSLQTTGEIYLYVRITHQIAFISLAMQD